MKRSRVRSCITAEGILSILENEELVDSKGISPDMYGRFCRKLNCANIRQNRRKIQVLIARLSKNVKKRKRTIRKPRKYNSSEFELTYKIRRTQYRLTQTVTSSIKKKYRSYRRTKIPQHEEKVKVSPVSVTDDSFPVKDTSKTPQKNTVKNSDIDSDSVSDTFHDKHSRGYQNVEEDTDESCFKTVRPKLQPRRTFDKKSTRGDCNNEKSVKDTSKTPQKNTVQYSCIDSDSDTSHDKHSRGCQNVEEDTGESCFETVQPKLQHRRKNDKKTKGDCNNEKSVKDTAKTPQKITVQYSCIDSDSDSDTFHDKHSRGVEEDTDESCFETVLPKLQTRRKNDKKTTRGDCNNEKSGQCNQQEDYCHSSSSETKISSGGNIDSSAGNETDIETEIDTSELEDVLRRDNDSPVFGKRRNSHFKTDFSRPGVTNETDENAYTYDHEHTDDIDKHENKSDENVDDNTGGMTNVTNEQDNSKYEDDSSTDTITSFKKKTLIINIPKVDWNRFKPSKHARKKLKSGWTDYLAKRLLKEMPSCSLSFKYHNIKKRKSRKSRCAYFTAKAKCKADGCGEFLFQVEKKPAKDQDVIQMNVTCTNINHSKKSKKHKRHLMRKNRKEYQQRLDSEGVSNIFYQKVGEMNDTQLASGNMTYCQTPTVLRKAKSEWNVHNNLHTDPFTELVITKEILEDEDDSSKNFKGYIQQIGFMPFFVAMFTEGQLNAIKKEMKKTKLVLYLDATGTVVEKVHDKRVLYYAVVMRRTKGSPPIPVFEFVSTSQTTPTITHALMIFLHSLGKIVQKIEIARVTTDFSWALIHSTLMAVSRINIHIYLQWCYNVTFNGNNSTKYTIVHICCNHLLKAFREKLSAITKDKTIKEYFIRCFCLIINSNILKDVVSFYQLMRHVFSSKTIQDGDENSLQQLEMCLQKATITPESSNEKSEDLICNVEWEEDGNITTIRRSSPFWSLFNDSGSSCSDNKQGNLNPFYCEDAMQMLATFFMPLLPLWSGLMLGDLERHRSKITCSNNLRDSNATVENWMRMVKIDTLGNTLRLRPGKFIRKLHKNLKGRLAAFDNNLHEFHPNKQKAELDDFNEAEESWAKKGAALPKKQAKYFSPMPKVQRKKQQTSKIEKSPDLHGKGKSQQKKNQQTSNLEESPDLQDKGKSQLPTHGIHNRLSTCWAISTFQALAASTIQLFGDEDDDIVRCANEIINILKVPVSTVEIHNIAEFRAKCKKDEEMRGRFQLGLQHDSAEFVEMLYRRGDFVMPFQSVLKCLQCKSERSKSEVIPLIPAEIPLVDSPSITHCVDEFLKEEVISDKRQNCGVCGKDTRHARRYVFDTKNIGNDICIQLKRFRQIKDEIEVEKNYSEIMINRVLCLSDEMIFYRLAAVQCHTGESMTEGHYWTISCSSLGDVLLKDDKHVSLKNPSYIDNSTVKKSAYVVIYTRLEVPNPFDENQKIEDSTIQLLNKLSSGSENEIVCRYRGGFFLRTSDIRTLTGNNWLNDQVINFYLKLVENTTTMCMDVLFYVDLKNHIETAIQRWVRRVRLNIFNYMKVLIPVVDGNHWTLCVADTMANTIVWYDSYIKLTNLRSKQRCMDLIRNALELLDTENERCWRTLIAKDVPQQTNGYDCGVFVAQFAVLTSLGLPMSCILHEARRHRYPMILECLSGNLFKRRQFQQD